MLINGVAEELQLPEAREAPLSRRMLLLRFAEMLVRERPETRKRC